MTWEIVVLILGLWVGIVIIFALSVQDAQDKRRFDEDVRRRGS